MQHATRTTNATGHRIGWRRTALLLTAALGLPAAALAQASEETGRSYAYGNLSHVDGDVWHQRSDDFGAHEAERGSPFLPGDRIWTREPGQVELRFAGGVTAWMDERTKLDYVEGDRPHRLGFWTGSLIVAVNDASEIVVETPGGTLAPQGRGEYRTDLLDDGRTVQFVVQEGIATVSNEWGSVLVGTGQRSLASEGTAPAPAEDYRHYDSFLAWTGDRQERANRAAAVPRDELPPEVREHTHDLDGHGHWHQDVYLGWVWYPTVTAGWAPYRLGRWAHTPFGYTWISYDPWGWAPFHYGSWGHGPRGWYWLPGSVWSPAWVSWAYGPGWIGWSPLGYYGRPVYGFWNRGYGYGRPGVRRGTVLGKAVPRGSRVNRQAWSFTNRKAVGRPASRNRLAASSLRNVEEARVLSGGAILDRGFRERAVGSTGMIRSAKATTRRLSNSSRRGAAAAVARSTPRAQRVATPSRAAHARTSWGSLQSGSGATSRAAGAGGTAERGAGASRSLPAAPRERAALRGTDASRRAGRPPRPRAAGSGSRAVRRPSSVRPSARSSASGASRSRPSSASRSRPSGASRSRPSSASRSRPSGASRSRPSSASRSRPSSASRSQPSSASRSQPSSARRRPNR